jgi:hypothetical protein
MSFTNPVSSHHRGDQKILIGIVLLKNPILTDFHIKHSYNLKNLIPQFKKLKIGLKQIKWTKNLTTPFTFFWQFESPKPSQ